MRSEYHNLLKTIFSKNVKKTRMSEGLSQAQMSEKLMMDWRSYSDIERKINSCSALTLLLYLIYCCDDAGKFLGEVKAALEKDGSNEDR